jgi:7-keto-8-aminopelargonate synthetase-like enzyme
MSQLGTMQSPIGAEIVVDGRRYINFGGSSYLGMNGRQEILEAGIASLRSTGAGYQIAREFNVATTSHQEVEEEAARFFQAPAALYTAAGYFFGLIAMTLLRSDFDVIFFDEVAHYCLRDAIAASGIPNNSFRHLDAEDLATKLAQHVRIGDRPLVVTDGMYSTLGEIAPLDSLARAVMPYGGRLLVDEPHSFGVLGETGRGAHEHFGVSDSIVLLGGSLCKAFGTNGGIIPATHEQIANMRRAPAVRGSSVGLPASAAMSATSLRYVREHPDLLGRLRTNIAFVKSGLRALGLNVGDSVAPVAAFSSGTAESMLALQNQLRSEGLFILHSNYIGAGSAGVIRCAIFADHTIEHLKSLLDALRRRL